MEIKGKWLADICGTTRQNVYMLTKQGKLTKSESGKYNIHDPKNTGFLKTHSKSILDVENYLITKDKTINQPNIINKKKETERKIKDESLILIHCISNVIEDEYGTSHAKKIKHKIMKAFKERCES